MIELLASGFTILKKCVCGREEEGEEVRQANRRKVRRSRAVRR